MERPFVLTDLRSIKIRSSGLLIVNIIMLTTMIGDARSSDDGCSAMYHEKMRLRGRKGRGGKREST